MRKACLVLFCAAALFPTIAAAASGVATFGGTILPSCVITVGAAGVLDVNAGGTTLSSTGGLGTPASVQVLATGPGFQVGVGTPSSFTLAPAGGNAGVSFQTIYSMSGNTIVSATPGGVNTTLNAGTATISINLSATRPTAFPAGVYSAQTVITCE